MKRTSPHIPIRPHAFTPDPADPGNWKGEKLCAGCSQPERSRVHKYTPAADESARIIGETGD